MYRKTMLVLLSMLLTLMIITGCTTGNKDNNVVPDTKEDDENQSGDNIVNDNNSFVDLEEAKDIALNEVNNKDGVIVDYELEGTWNNYTHHEFEIQLDNEKYEVKVDAKTGDVIKTKSKQNNHKIEEYSRYIDFDEAKRIALDNMNDKNDVIISADLEDHNEANKRAYYEFEVHSEKAEYELKIDAESGEVILRE